MTTRQETLVVCLVETSVTLLHEWSGILLTYVSPLLQRMATGNSVKGIRSEFRIGFVSYSDPHIHPNPILGKRFFSPPLQMMREMKEEPANLGLGRTASGNQRGMAILEGYVAVLEMFDAEVETRVPQPLRPQPSNEAQPDPPLFEPVCYLIHIASSPPNKATRPTWNMNPDLDTVTWESLPSHLLKRKIRTTMVLTRPIAELQGLHSNLSRTPESFPLPLIKPSHKLLLSGLPPVLKDKTVPQKRPAADNLDAPPPPARPQPAEQPTLPPANPTPPIATPSTVPNLPNPRPANAVSSQPTTVPQVQPSSQPQPPAQPSQPRLNLPGQNLDIVKLVSFIRALEAECRSKQELINQARAAGKPKAELDMMQADLTLKDSNRRKLVDVYQQIIVKQQLLASRAPGSNPTNQNPQQMNFGQNVAGAGQARPEQPTSHIPQPNAAASGSGQVAQTSPARTAANTPFAAFGGASMNKNPFQGIPISARPGMEAQMQKMLAERTRPPVLAAAPQSQALPPPNHVQPAQVNQNPGGSGTNPQIAEIMTPRMNMGPHIRRWQGVLAWPSANTGGRKENQIAIALYSQDVNLRCESWAQKLILQPSRAPLNMQDIQTWNKESNPVMGLISHTPIIGNLEGTAQNMRLFRQLRDLIQTKSMLAYCKIDMAGGPPGTGLLTFPMSTQAQSDILVAMVFHNSPLPSAVTAHAMQAPPANVGSSNDVPPHQPMGAGALQNMSQETKAFLQQRQAAAIAAYSQQQAAGLAYGQQQAAQQQHNGMIPNLPGGNPGPGAASNVAQFMQNMQRARWNPEG